MRSLVAYNNDVKAGVLTEHSAGRNYSFKYDSAYLSADFPPISVNLPKRQDAYESEFLFPFFANMLPEGANRRIICSSLKIDENDDFSLLCAMAGCDFIGAVSVDIA